MELKEGKSDKAIPGSSQQQRDAAKSSHQGSLETETEDINIHEDIEKLDLIKVLMSLEQDYFLNTKARQQSEKPEEGAEEDVFHDSNPGCWICGPGDLVDLPHDFTNPILVSKFSSRLLMIMLGSTAWRTACLSVSMLCEPVHYFLYTTDMMGFSLIYFCFSLFSITFFALILFVHMKKFTKCLYMFPFNIFVYFGTEVSFTCMQIFFSLTLEQAIQKWYATRDFYGDLTTKNGDLKAPETWPDLDLSPAFFLVSSNIQIFINLISALCIDTYTKLRLGSVGTYQLMCIETLATTVLLVPLAETASYRVAMVWDTIQIYCSAGWALLTTLLFIHYVQRIVTGKNVRLRGMQQGDIWYSAMRICFV